MLHPGEGSVRREQHGELRRQGKQAVVFGFHSLPRKLVLNTANARKPIENGSPQRKELGRDELHVVRWFLQIAGSLRSRNLAVWQSCFLPQPCLPAEAAWDTQGLRLLRGGIRTV